MAGSRSQRHDGQRRVQAEPPLRLADELGRLVAVEHGHVAVHEDHVDAEVALRAAAADRVALRVEQRLD